MNLLDIHLDPLNSPGVMSAKLWIRDGSRSDPDGQKGIHQILASLLSRGCGPFGYIQLADLIEGCGAGLHCETYEDGLLISLKCIEKDAYQLIPVIGWMLKNPHLNNGQIELEKQLSIQSLKRQKENPFYLAFDGWRHLAYGEGQYGHDPLGSIDNLEKIGKEELLPLSKSLLNRKKILVISGSFPNDLGSQINTMEAFDFSREKNEYELHIPLVKNIFPVTYQIKGTNITTEPQDTAQVVMMLGRPTVPHGHEDNLSLHLLSCYLGSGMSSRLFVELREKHGVAYDVGVHHPTREYASPFVIHASTSEDKCKKTLKLLQENWKSILETPLSNEDLKLAKSKFRSQLAHSSQTVGQRGERKAHLLGINLRPDHDQQNLKKIDSISARELQEAAHRHLHKPLLSLCGPQKNIMRLAEYWKS